MRKIKKTRGKKQIKPTFSYLGLDCDSYEEILFLYYIEELIQEGLVSKVTRCPSYILTNGIKNEYIVEQKLKTKIKVVAKSETILEPSLYTPDFKIYFNEEGKKIFTWLLGSKSKCDKPFINDLLSLISGETTVEVKGSFTGNYNMVRVFQNNKKFLYDKHLIFTNLVIPDELFKKTFLPEKAKYTFTRKKRKITYNSKTLKEFLNENNN